jgi:hypothetical protein
MHELVYNKTDQKRHFILGNPLYMFQQQGAIFREFINNKGLLIFMMKGG